MILPSYFSTWVSEFELVNESISVYILFREKNLFLPDKLNEY